MTDSTDYGRDEALADVTRMEQDYLRVSTSRQAFIRLRNYIASLSPAEEVDLERSTTMPEMLPNQKKPNLSADEVQTLDCPACTQPTLHIVRAEQKCCLQCAADGGSTMPGYVPLSAFNRWSE